MGTHEFTQEGLAILRRHGWLPWQLIRHWHRYQKKASILFDEDGNGRTHTHQCATFITIRSRRGLTFERLDLPGGEFRRITKTNTGELVRFTNLTESRKPY